MRVNETPQERIKMRVKIPSIKNGKQKRHNSKIQTREAKLKNKKEKHGPTKAPTNLG